MTEVETEQVVEVADSAMMIKSPASYPLIYLHYYSGHVGRHGHEFLEFEVKPMEGGLIRYTNNSNYLKSGIIKKSMCVSALVLKEFQRLVLQSTILDRDDSLWPEPDRDGRQTLEIVLGQHHISFVTNKIGTTDAAKHTQDPAGMLSFIFLVQDLKSMIVNLISSHYRERAI
jgi:protein mago nashi